MNNDKLKELVSLMTRFDGEIKFNRYTLNQADEMYNDGKLVMWYLSTGTDLTEQFCDLETFAVLLGDRFWLLHGDNVYNNFEPRAVSYALDERISKYVTHYMDGVPRVTHYVTRGYLQLLQDAWIVGEEVID